MKNLHSMIKKLCVIILFILKTISILTCFSLNDISNTIQKNKLISRNININNNRLLETNRFIICSELGECKRSDKVQLKLGWVPKTPLKNIDNIFEINQKNIASIDPFYNTSQVDFIKGSNRYVCADGINECFNSCCYKGYCSEPSNVCSLAIKNSDSIFYSTTIVFLLLVIGFWLFFGYIGAKYSKKKAAVKLTDKTDNINTNNINNNNNNHNVSGFNNNLHNVTETARSNKGGLDDFDDNFNDKKFNKSSNLNVNTRINNNNNNNQTNIIDNNTSNLNNNINNSQRNDFDFKDKDRKISSISGNNNSKLNTKLSDKINLFGNELDHNILGRPKLNKRNLTSIKNNNINNLNNKNNLNNNINNINKEENNKSAAIEVNNKNNNVDNDDDNIFEVKNL